MGEAVQALSALFVELEDINKLLNDYEKTRNTKALSQAAVKIKTGAPKLKEIISNPAYKNADTAPLMTQLKNGFRDAFSRAKSLKDGGGKGGDDRGDEEEPVSVPRSSASQKAVTNGSPAANGKHKDRERERRERDTSQEESNGNGNGVDEEDERRKDRERRKREEEREKERQRREAKKRAEEEEERKKNNEEERAKDEIKRKEDQARKQFEEEEAKDKEFRRQAYLKKKEEEAKRAEQAKRIMENGEGEDETDSTDLRAKFKGKDIWSSILKDNEVKSQAEYNEGNFGDSDYSLIFVGSKNSGKTTLLNRFLEKSGEPKSSTALEYSYGRHAKSSGVAKDAKEVVHTWELAGGTSLAPLFEVCLTPEGMQNAVVVIVLDLSEPATVMETLSRWQDTIRARSEECMKRVEKSNPALYEGLKRASLQNYPNGHPDKETVKPLSIPTIIVGSKYDLFQDFEAERRKVCVRTLRYFANANGASLVFLTAKDGKDDGTFTKFRALLNYYLFHTPHNRTPVIEYTKPVLVPAGSDTFEAIGKAPFAATKSGAAAWKASFDQVFPPAEEKAQDLGRFEEDFAKFSEPAIDAMRLEKEKELERLRRLKIRGEQPNGNSSSPSNETAPTSRRKKFST